MGESSTPNLDRELREEDDLADDQQSGTPGRVGFEKIHGEDSRPSGEAGSPPTDNTPPPPDSNEPLREPTNNPTDTSPDR